MLETEGLRPAPRKPVESGCQPDASGKLVASDARRLANAMKQPPPLTQVCGFQFSAMTSPAYAAKLAKTRMTLNDLANVCNKHDDEVLVVEGAGGLLSPLTGKHSNADLVTRLGLPIFLVVADKLGCINHTLLSLMAADSLGIKTLAIILNHLSRTSGAPPEMDNFQELKMLSDIPIIRMESVGQHACDLITLITTDNHP